MAKIEQNVDTRKDTGISLTNFCDCMAKTVSFNIWNNTFDSIYDQPYHNSIVDTSE